MKIVKNIASCCSISLSLKGFWAFVVLFLFICSVGVGQTNLVINPSFEDTLQCPTNGWITHAANWQPFSSSPDYYNSCVPSWSLYSVPNNYFGEQIAASGQAYAGIFCYVEGETDYSSDREILGGNLTTPLTIGQKYFVSFKVALTLNTQNTGSSLAINKLGVLFSTISYSNIDSTTIPPIENFAHVYTDSIITDSTNWTTIFGSFTADSAYMYICVGNFFRVDSTDTVHVISTNPFTPNAYYFIDDICVSTDSAFCANYIYTGIEEEQLNDNFNIYPNPVTDYFQVNQTFTEPYDLTIYNALGQQLYQEKNITANSKTINTTAFTKGLLLINIKSSNQSINYKLLKQ